jgi:hypothetical protein
MRAESSWRGAGLVVLACGLTVAGCTASAREDGGKKKAEPAGAQQSAVPREQPPSPAPPAKPAEKAAKPAAKPITEFPKAIHGFKGRLQGIISAVNKQGIVLSDIFGVDKEYPPSEPGGLMELRPVERDAPEAWLFGKTVQLLCPDNEYKKNYCAGNSIGGSVHWSEKHNALVITGAQWYGTGGGEGQRPPVANQPPLPGTPPPHK